MNFSVEQIVFILSILLIVGVLTAKFSSRLGVPSLVLFIIVGMGLNRFFYFDNVKLTTLVGTIALVIILFDGGINTKWRDMKRVMVPAGSLATFGVLLTTVIMGAFAKYILGFSWLEGLLVGAIVGSTDAAAVFAALGERNIRFKLKTTLEAESASNDPMAIFLTVSLIELIQTPGSSYFQLLPSFFWQMGLGLILGLLFGKVSVYVINQINLDSSGLYPVLALSFAALTYGVTSLLHASGLLAVYVMAIIVGNSDLTYRHSIIRFHEGSAWMMQITMFILLGLLVFPSELIKITWQGLLLSFLLMLVARPMSVFITMLFMKYTFGEKLLISWAGLRGAVPVVLATYPLVAGIENSMLMFNVVFFVVLTSALLQGATITPLANALGLSEGAKVTIPHSVELVSIGKTNNEMMEIILEEKAVLVGKKIKEIELPEESLISAIIRGDKLVTPRGDTTLQANDILYILVAKKKREKVKAIFQDILPEFNPESELQGESSQ
ncbi:MAG TPA: potassium/proton antiporter [Bacillus bacterium]|uniref:K+/H+ antiporter n=1 Tax=Siminovitchia fordii TaxID=254759 RepID=A0ABQ4K6F7_9BACI|nr:potassium/proton antiporter [Siminovitchia fordii]GIN21316.1 K+/H+ antiporter [Siminovitchia fordii]HBZ10621.1 potassium/proton antiporter [Bacillus sp. (in: firmicutes)]